MLINELSLRTIKERKNRAILAYSETSKTYRFLYNFAVKYLDSSADEIEYQLSRLSREEENLLNNMLPQVLSLCKDEWKGDEELLIPAEIIEREEERIPCSLCNFPKTKEVFYIRNKISSKKINVGSTCITEFSNLVFKGGKTKNQILREAKRNQRLKYLLTPFPGIKRYAENWESELKVFEILIPSSLEKPYLELGIKLKAIYEDFLNEKVDKRIFKQISSLLDIRKSYLDQMKSYCREHRNDRFIVTRAMIRWLENKREHQVIETLKESGYVTYETAEIIHEAGFINFLIPEINKYLETIGLRIVEPDYDREGYIISFIENPNVKLICRFGRFINSFGWKLFEQPRFAEVNLKNILHVSSLLDRASYDTILEKIRGNLKGIISLSLYKSADLDYFDLNEVDLYNRQLDKVYVLNLRKFTEEFKHIAFNIGTSNDVLEYVNSLSRDEYRIYRREELRELRRLSKSTFN